ncbi:hypothetical protein SCLCIDRAFT_605318 [Scleroderma citrinum Foug A]|uniref:Uncharacterized protein n=1 Tax=Scleroderma citrinum Foug A TaxID=1036808 RepID=A0A0C2ZFX1_9AGAM|nr:hypothetical protein SCLCIDRAFT_605318 [Scleroderma citrinum Foug A]
MIKSCNLHFRNSQNVNDSQKDGGWDATVRNKVMRARDPGGRRAWVFAESLCERSTGLAGDSSMAICSANSPE